MFNMLKKTLLTATMGMSVALPIMMTAAKANDQFHTGNFMMRGFVSGLTFDESFKLDPAIGNEDAGINDIILPTATLDYFVTNDISLQLFCCFTRHTVKGKGALAGLGDVADTWVFPPMVSVQKHFNMGQFKPYIGVGVSYMKFFNEKVPGSSVLAAANYTDVDVSDGWGVNAQIGVDVSLGDGWVASAELRKSWIDADVKWSGAGVPDIKGDLDLNPLVVSVGFGRRFDLF